MEYLGGFFGLAIYVSTFAAWLTALVRSAQEDAWVLFVTSLIVPPWGVCVGIGSWLGVW